MSHFPHDEFDDVAPYSSGEAGKHRAPGAYAAGGGAAAAAGSSGLMKGIGVLAVLAIVVVAAVYLILPLFSSDDDPEAGQTGDEGAVEEQEGDPDAEGGEEGQAEGEGAEENGEAEDANGDEDAAQEDEDGVDMDTPLQVANAGAPDWSGSDVDYRLTQEGFNTTGRLDWDSQWGQVSTPVVFYPDEGQAEFAQAVAEFMGFENTAHNPAWSTPVIVVGPEYSLQNDIGTLEEFVNSGG